MRESLIQLVKDMSPIWDLTNDSHHKINVIANCWIAIREEMEETFSKEELTLHGLSSEDELKAAWQSLRTQFRLQKKLLSTPKSGSGLSDVTTSKWQYFQQMKFLDQCIISVPTENSFIFQTSENTTLEETNGSSGEPVVEEINTSSFIASMMEVPSFLNRHPPIPL